MYVVLFKITFEEKQSKNQKSITNWLKNLVYMLLYKAKNLKKVPHHRRYLYKQ